MTDTDRITQLEARIAHLEARLARLEAATRPAMPHVDPSYTWQEVRPPTVYPMGLPFVVTCGA